MGSERRLSQSCPRGVGGGRWVWSKLPSQAGARPLAGTPSKRVLLVPQLGLRAGSEGRVCASSEGAATEGPEGSVIVAQRVWSPGPETGDPNVAPSRSSLMLGVPAAWVLPVPTCVGPPGGWTVTVSGGGFLAPAWKGQSETTRFGGGTQCPRFGNLKSFLRTSCFPSCAVLSSALTRGARAF